MKILLQIDEEELPVFMAYLGIGVLQSILTDTVSAEVGIWSLGAPKTWEFLEALKLDKNLIEVFQTADELETLKKHVPERFKGGTSDLIKRLQNVLLQAKNVNWDIQWFIKE